MDSTFIIFSSVIFTYSSLIFSYVQSFLMIYIVGIEKKLLFSTFNDFKEKDLDTGVVRTLFSQNENVYSMAYNHKQRYMYVPRYGTGDIVR